MKSFRDGVGETAEAIAADPDAFRKFLPEASEIPPPAAEQAVLPEWKVSRDPESLELTAELMERYGVTPEKPDTSEALAE